MSTPRNTERPMIEERGTPREIAQRLTRLPEGEYRVFVQRVQTCEETLETMNRIAESIRANPDSSVANKSDDEVMDLVNAIIDEERAHDNARRRA